MAQGLAIPVPLNSVCDLMHTTEKNIRLGGPSLHMVFGPGSFLCTNFFVLFLGEQRKSILLPQMKDTHNCNQSNWTIALNLKKKAGRTTREKREQRLDPGVLPTNLILSIPPNLVFSAGGGAHDNGELRRKWGDTRLLPTPQPELKLKGHGWPPSVPRLTPASKFLSLSLFHKMHLFINFRTI